MSLGYETGWRQRQKIIIYRRYRVKDSSSRPPFATLYANMYILSKTFEGRKGAVRDPQLCQSVESRLHCFVHGNLSRARAIQTNRP